MVLAWVVAVGCGGGGGGGDGSSSETGSETGVLPTTGSVGDDSSGAIASSGSETGGSDTTVTTADDTGTTGDAPLEVTPGASCSPMSRLGTVNMSRAGATFEIYGQIYEGVDPWIGEPELTNDTCAFHRFDPGACGVCPGGQVCSAAGDCVPPRLVRTDVGLRVVGDGVSTDAIVDPVSGTIYGSVEATESPLSLTLTLGDEEVELPPMVMASAPAGVLVSGQGDSCAPEALDVTWTPADDDRRVRTEIPINHHAAGPTFTHCEAGIGDPGLHADGPMLVPLAVVTCLEFQGVTVGRVASITTAAGCIEVWLRETVAAGEVTWS